jgi:hypothetical protein
MDQEMFEALKAHKGHEVVLYTHNNPFRGRISEVSEDIVQLVNPSTVMRINHLKGFRCQEKSCGGE